MWRSGRTEIETMGGLVHTVPAQATVMILSCPSSSAAVTMTTGRGYSIFPAFHSILLISVLPPASAVALLESPDKGRDQLFLPGDHAGKQIASLLLLNIKRFSH